LAPFISKIPQMPRYVGCLAVIFILILPALLFANLSSVSATLLREIYEPESRPHILPAPGGGQAEDELAQGKFLVADSRLRDPNFRETVVLLIRYGPDGTMGLVINRPLQMKLSKLFPDVKELQQSKKTLYLGGPVEPGGLLLLVRSAEAPEDAMPVFEDVYLSSSGDLLRRLIEKPEKEDRFRIYTGYAGWSPEQLESECRRGDWHVLDADVATLFDRQASEIWPELIKRTSANWVHLKGAERFRVRG
jgi:putative transcriptional regulator